jgi:RNA polymerase sigma factor (sigma-70 family)
MQETTNRLHKVLGNLRMSCDDLSDAQLLARFVNGQDEAAFAMLVRRHGPMVLGVCRRVLRHSQDAEDVFQATFLILARKARSVLSREAIGSWLYRVAFRAAQEARALRARRRAKEKQMDDTLQPTVNPAEVQDWRHLLDHELNRLPEKYQAAIVLCDLEARTRKEVARQLGIAESTLSSRLAYGRKLLASRLARRGVALGGGALVGSLSEGVLAANVPGSLVSSTTKAAVLVAAGKLAMVATPVAILMKGVMKSMFIAKLKTVVGFSSFVVLAIGFGGLAYQTVGAQNVPPAKQNVRPLNELEALRKENELLKLNLQVVLEKFHAQEIEIRTLKSNAAVKKTAVLAGPGYTIGDFDRDGILELYLAAPNSSYLLHASQPKAPSLDDALKRLREAKSEPARRQAIEALEHAVQRLRAEMDKTKNDDPVAKQ